MDDQGVTIIPCWWLGDLGLTVVRLGCGSTSVNVGQRYFEEAEEKIGEIEAGHKLKYLGSGIDINDNTRCCRV